MNHFMVIGNGTAAVGCIEGIRSVDNESVITVISSEKYPAYCRPLISYYLEGKTSLERISYREDDFYEKNHCTVLYGETAVKLDKIKKMIVLESGEEYHYDALCIATGSSPFIPPMDGIDTVEEKYTFSSLDDTLALEKKVGKESRVLIIGAGLIGLKCAEGLHDRVKSITVCDLADRVLSSILDEESAEIVRKHLENNNISFILGDSVSKFTKQAVTMKSGVEIDFDILIIAVGVRPNISLIRNCGGNCGKAISVDKHMKTSVNDVYAAGDCTENLDVSSKIIKIMALLPNAYMQGRCAGINMAGGDIVYDNAIPMNSIGLFGLHIMTAGTRYNKEDGGVIYEENSDGNVKKMYTKNNRLTGFILIGNVDRAGIYTYMIRTRAALDTVDFNKLRDNPDLSAFDLSYRKKILGGVI